MESAVFEIIGKSIREAKPGTAANKKCRLSYLVQSEIWVHGYFTHYGMAYREGVRYEKSTDIEFRTNDPCTAKFLHEVYLSGNEIPVLALYQDDDAQPKT